MSALSNFLASLGAALVTDEAKLVQPPLENYLTSLAADPSLINANVQSLKFAVDVQALAPQAGSTAIKDTATALKSFVDLQLPTLIQQVAAEIAAQGNSTPAAAPPPQAAPAPQAVAAAGQPPA